jgi:hypothetical protein
MNMETRQKSTPGWMVIAISALALAACSEIPQDAVKPFAGKEETRPYAGDRFGGDKGLYEKTMAERAQTQNEYLVVGGAKTRDTVAVHADPTSPRSPEGRN